jgi:F-type H+-transporting ATPase subunit b
MPQLDVATYSSQIFWLCTCLIMLYISLKYIFIPRLESSIEARKKKIESLMLDAEKLRLESDALNIRYSEEIKKTHLDAFALHKKAMKEFDDESSKELAKLNQHQQQKLEEFREEITHLKKDIEKNIEKESDILLQKLIEKVKDSKPQKKMKEKN